ncbi:MULTISPECIES: zinc-binding dehydrogenase [unclassified Pigmentiphaga]|uniref:zinc-binding dehydrogenase n=1 Tax=unclassified Pigmentiphaga TaxID=2626614 RepID=UPI000B4078F3|nr:MULTISPECIES: zinc-binding dehydrogenase [unclassified Pigmentiphaga]OVZ65180.1 hypothetical protein CDO46_07230 [Pigmentiphaga sp. NML030171]
MSTIPATHEVIHISAPGDADVLKLATRDVPRCGDDDLLVAVAAAGINRHDVNQRRRGPEPGVPDVPGLELAGTVVRVGRGVKGWNVGDQVCGLVDGGAYARYATMPASHALPIPDGMSLLEAGALPEALFTIWHNFFNVAGMRAGEVVLIHGGTSGVGTIAIQLLTALGHQVFVTCGTDEKCTVARELGAIEAFNYTRDDWVAGIRAASTDGADVILDMAAGRYAEQNLQALARRGRVVHLSPGQGASIRVHPVM